MSEVVWTIALYALVVLGAVIIMLGAGMATAAAMGIITGWLDSRKAPPPPEDPRPLERRWPSCPSHGFEHLCKQDPIDTAALTSMAEFLRREDPAWYARMTKRLKI